jgi:hypothetical protein
VNDYVFVVGPGVICALFSDRYDGPHWSEIALAVYRHYETEELKYVFRVHVVNDKTHDFVGDLYTKFDYDWPNMQARNWERGSHEYSGLLATPNVRGVVALMLGEFARGTRYVPYVMTWTDNYQKRGRLHMCIPISRVEV